MPPKSIKFSKFVYILVTRPECYQVHAKDLYEILNREGEKKVQKMHLFYEKKCLIFFHLLFGSY